MLTTEERQAVATAWRARRITPHGAHRLWTGLGPDRDKG